MMMLAIHGDDNDDGDDDDNEGNGIGDDADQLWRR